MFLDKFHRTVLRECEVLFEGAPSDTGTSLMTQRILSGGAFGSPENNTYRKQLSEGEDSATVKKAIIGKILGTNRENMYRKYPVLEKAPYLLPFCHIHRITSGLIRKPGTVLICWRLLRSVSDEKIEQDRELLRETGLIQKEKQ